MMNMMNKNTLLAVLLTLTAAGASANNNKVEIGKAAVEKCVACHGANFNETLDSSYPKLAGQHKDYLIQALKAYQRGVKGTAGRNNAIMAGQVQDLSNEQIEAIATYLNSLPTTLVVKK